ncbi:MAG TPA: hypothetical protein VMU18_09640, partial [Rhodoblastus sp.]|nr:hypothetical protein [Rhodoblastus sp.]
MTRIAPGAALALLLLSSPAALARSVGEAFQDVVAKESAADKRPAQECDARECRRWWWRDDNRGSSLAVEHIKADDGERVLAVCWRDIDSADEMRCLSTAGRKFGVSPGDAARWRQTYIAANAAASAPAGGLDLDLTCSAPVVAKGDVDPGRNPVVAVHVRFNDGDWSVAFKFADGSTVERADQYKGGNLSAAQLARNNRDAKQPAIAQWAGDHRRRADTFMISSLYRDTPSAYR